MIAFPKIFYKKMNMDKSRIADLDRQDKRYWNRFIFCMAYMAKKDIIIYAVYA